MLIWHHLISSSAKGGGDIGFDLVNRLRTGVVRYVVAIKCYGVQYCLRGGGEIRSGCHGSHKTNNERDIEGDN